MKAFLKNYRQSPRKVRLVADLVKGKNVTDATVALDLLPKRAGLPIRKLILSAISNAKQIGADADVLFIKELRVDKGIVMKRFMPRAMGRASRINKRTSHITLLLGEKVTEKKKPAQKTKTEKVKKVVSKTKKTSTKVENQK